MIFHAVLALDAEPPKKRLEDVFKQRLIAFFQFCRAEFLKIRPVKRPVALCLAQRRRHICFGEDIRVAVHLFVYPFYGLRPFLPYDRCQQRGYVRTVQVKR